MTYPCYAFIDFISELEKFLSVTIHALVGLFYNCIGIMDFLRISLQGYILHISASVPYDCEPSNIYGALYQRVATP